MGTNLFVGNLSSETTVGDLRTLFSQAGAVESVTVVRDHVTGRPRGFAFVEMKTEAAALEAIGMFNGTQLEDRVLTVSMARPREEGRRRRQHRPHGGDGRHRS